MKKVLLLSLMLALLLPLSGYSQEARTVTGVVTDASTGQPLPGVAVLVQGTTVGVTTGAEGRYSIVVPPNQNTLVFRFLGYTTVTRNVGNAATIDVALGTDTEQLQEVVVTALGIEKTRNELPYAAEQVDGEQVTTTRDNNLVNALSGKVAGVNIQRNNSLGGSTNIVIRGAKSLTQNNQALFVVDGVPISNAVSNTLDQSTGRGGYDYGNAAADINPEDIASITVLKGAAATALYGSRAANGVVMITTKKGRGREGIGVTINSSVNFGSIDPDTFVDFQDQYGAGYGTYYPSPDGYFLYADVDGDGQPDRVVPTTEDASYGAQFNPNLLVYQWNAFDESSPFFGQPRPWVAAENDPNEFFQNSFGTTQSIALDANNEGNYFNLRYTYTYDEGILPNSEIQKDYFNFAAGYNLTDRFKASASVNYTVVEGLGRYGTGYDVNNLLTNFRQWWQVNVDIEELEDAYNRTGRNITWNWANPLNPAEGLVPIYWDNPYWTRFENYQNDSRQRIFGNIRVDYELADWLSLMGRISLDSYDELQEERTAVGSLNPAVYLRNNNSFREYNYDLMANFERDLSESFSLNGVLGTNIRRTLISSISASTNGGLVVPGLYSLANSLNPITAPTENESELQVNGYFASATLGYRDLAFLDVAYRIDQASSLAIENNAYPYGSISGSFVFTELMEPRYWLTNGKLRLNYAEVGNMAPAGAINIVYANPFDPYNNPNPLFGTAPLYSLPNTRNNPELEPERTESYEAGLEMSFFDARAGFDVTYYKTNSINQILPVTVSPTTGYSFQYVNSGNIENRGWEVSVYGTPVKTDNFSWTINANWTRNRNEVKELYTDALGNETENIQLASFQGGVSINATLGEPYGTIRGTDFVYLNGQRVVGPDGFYLRTPTSNQVIGNINPDWVGGVTNILRYKGLSFSFLIDVKNGGDIFSLDQYYGLATGVSEATTFINDLGNPVRNTLAEGGGVIFPGVQQDGTVNTVRAPASNYGTFGYARNPAAGFVYDAGYVKLREVTLTYSLPATLIEKLGPIQEIQVSAFGRNLWIIDKELPYADPEEGLGASNFVGGYQGGAYPTTRIVGINLKARL
ncbi:TonB-linked SusC/RagA family outer membrane protein [Pontibacter ummariensis]|uniref:TonB-linked outer membrane protein, SusC/RagA family n=1 Tax=Pontibacter ummariensis TaxID=1610492 RepID=A0A239E046_9BACT|nr:SusC/RagA family TonB-linked outer membrane protein [Pontibacter ummariensis]PRY13669.1 TonB-linked SusC/RagA family outer membrane protein [Pontibacter ummariensis]SNS37889.1 TonB-linked outer membrane protein, SusC/RagA family [Pontibacter ummariensis]